MNPDPNPEDLLACIPEAVVALCRAEAVEPEYLPDPVVVALARGTATAADRTTAAVWIADQVRHQAEAAALVRALDAEFPLRPEAVQRGTLPGWVVEWWRPVLQVPWSRDLAAAVRAGQAWRITQRDPTPSGTAT